MSVLEFFCGNLGNEHVVQMNNENTVWTKILHEWISHEYSNYFATATCRALFIVSFLKCHSNMYIEGQYKATEPHYLSGV